MNKYLVEDEHSFYEIDPDCRIEPVKQKHWRKKEAQQYGKTDASRSIEKRISLILLCCFLKR